MKRGYGLVLLACLVATAAVPALAQEGMPPMGPPEEMKMIASLDGEYDVVFMFKMDPAAADFQEAKGSCTLSSMLGGACQKMEFSANMMGMPFKGVGWTAYSRGQKRWQTTWVDNMNATISYYLGDMKDGEMVFEGEDFGPDGNKVYTRMTSHNMTDSGFDWKMEMSMDGSEYITGAKATYRRVGGSTGASSTQSSGEEDSGGW